MRKIILIISILLFLIHHSYAQVDNAQNTVLEFFEGMSSLDEYKLRSHITEDFLLLEDGGVWTIDTLLLKISPMKNVKFTRINKLSFITTQQNDDMAWVCYHNTADFTVNDQQQTRNWLESAVLKKEDGTWKIQLLHSTRIKK